MQVDTFQLIVQKTKKLGKATVSKKQMSCIVPCALYLFYLNDQDWDFNW